jgi:hypothetical protein
VVSHKKQLVSETDELESCTVPIFNSEGPINGNSRVGCSTLLYAEVLKINKRAMIILEEPMDAGIYIHFFTLHCCHSTIPYSLLKSSLTVRSHSSNLLLYFIMIKCDSQRLGTRRVRRSIAFTL